MAEWWPSGGRVVAISCGDSHLMAVTQTGQLFAWGNDWQGQLGTG